MNLNTEFVRMASPFKGHYSVLTKNQPLKIVDCGWDDPFGKLCMFCSDTVAKVLIMQLLFTIFTPTYLPTYQPSLKHYLGHAM